MYCILVYSVVGIKKIHFLRISFMLVFLAHSKRDCDSLILHTDEGRMADSVLCIVY